MAAEFFTTEIDELARQELALKEEDELRRETDYIDSYETYSEQEATVQKTLTRQKDLSQKTANKKARQKVLRLKAQHECEQTLQRKIQEAAVLPWYEVHDSMKIYEINMRENAQRAMEAQAYSKECKEREAQMAELLSLIKSACLQTPDETDF